MYRFTIREVMLLAALVGTGLAWRLEINARHMVELQLKEARGHAEVLRLTLGLAEKECKWLSERYLNRGGSVYYLHPSSTGPNWELVRKRIP